MAIDPHPPTALWRTWLCVRSDIVREWQTAVASFKTTSSPGWLSPGPSASTQGKCSFTVALCWTPSNLFMLELYWMPENLSHNLDSKKDCPWCTSCTAGNAAQDALGLHQGQGSLLMHIRSAIYQDLMLLFHRAAGYVLARHFSSPDAGLGTGPCWISEGSCWPILPASEQQCCLEGIICSLWHHHHQFGITCKLNENGLHGFPHLIDEDAKEDGFQDRSQEYSAYCLWVEYDPWITALWACPLHQLSIQLVDYVSNVMYEL